MIDEPVVNASGNPRKPNSGMEYRATSHRNFSITRPMDARPLTSASSWRPREFCTSAGLICTPENPRSFAVIFPVDGQRHTETGRRAQGATVQPCIHRLQCLQFFREAGSERAAPTSRSWKAWRGAGGCNPAWLSSACVTGEDDELVRQVRRLGSRCRATHRAYRDAAPGSPGRCVSGPDGCACRHRPVLP